MKKPNPRQRWHKVKPKPSQFTKEHRENIAKALRGKVDHRAKTYKVKFPDGRIEHIHNLKQFCEERGWSYVTARWLIWAGYPYFDHMIERVYNHDKK